MNEQKQIDFDDFSDDYRRYHTDNVKAATGEDSYYFSMLKVKELTFFEKNKQQQVLDIGCGDGVSEIYFQYFFSEFKVFGVDISEASILKAKTKSLSNTEFSKYDGITLPFSDSRFDIVFIACVLHHVEINKQFAFIEEAMRVLKTGGRLYIFEHNPFNPITQHLVNTCVFDKGVRLIRPGVLKRRLKKARATVLSLNFILFFPRHKLFHAFLFLEKYLKRIPIGGQYYLRCTKD